MKISGPVRVPPMTPMTRSKRGTSSPMRTARPTSNERTRQRRRLNSVNYKYIHKDKEKSFQIYFLVFPAYPRCAETTPSYPLHWTGKAGVSPS